MKDLLIKAARQTGIVDAEQLAEFLEKNKTDERLDELLLRCPYFTEETILKLFAAVLCHGNRQIRCGDGFPLGRAHAAYQDHLRR